MTAHLDPDMYCHEEGHVPGCPGKAGGDHELDSTPDPSWEEDEDGFIVEPLVNRGDLNREGDPAFNGAFDKW